MKQYSKRLKWVRNLETYRVSVFMKSFVLGLKSLSNTGHSASTNVNEMGLKGSLF